MARWFSASTLNRGRHYANRGQVIKNHVRWDGTVITVEARVKGSQRQSYQVMVELDLKRKNITGICSCPVGYHCKHMVAALLTAHFPQEEVEPPLLSLNEGPNSSLSTWISRLEESLNPSQTNVSNEIVI